MNTFFAQSKTGFYHVLPKSAREYLRPVEDNYDHILMNAIFASINLRFDGNVIFYSITLNRMSHDIRLDKPPKTQAALLHQRLVNEVS